MEEKRFYHEWSDKYPYPTIVMKNGDQIEMVERIGAPIDDEGHANVFYGADYYPLSKITISFCDVDRFEKISKESAGKLERVIQWREIELSFTKHQINILKNVLNSLR